MELASNSTQFSNGSQPPFPPDDDTVLDTLLAALKATLGHPELCGAAEVMIAQVRRIQDEARERMRNKYAHEDGSLINEIAAALKIDPARLLSRDRSQSVASKRAVAMWLLRKLSAVSYTEVGTIFGRDHSSCIHNCQIVDQRIKDNPQFRLFVKKLEAGITGITPVRSAA